MREPATATTTPSLYHRTRKAALQYSVHEHILPSPHLLLFPTVRAGIPALPFVSILVVVWFSIPVSMLPGPK